MRSHTILLTADYASSSCFCCSDAALPGEGSAEAFVVFMDGSVSLLSLCRGQEAAVSPSAAAGRLTVAGAGSCRDRLAILTSQGAKEAMLTVYIAEVTFFLF